MDDIFDSLIYIIITIVAFAISALGKKKKNDARRVQRVEENNPEPRQEKPFMSNLEELLNQELGLSEQENKVVEQEEYIQQKYQSYNDEEVLDTVPEEMLDDKEDVPYSIEYENTSKPVIEQLEVDDLSNSEEEEVIEDFDLREAIIYSEILNRKEY